MTMKKISLVLIPGLLCDQEVWSHQCHLLSDIASIIIPNLNHQENPQQMIQSVLGIAPHHFALAGHSMGGWIALEIMKKSPERVLGLALLNTTAFPDSEEKHATRKKLIKMAQDKDFSSIIETLATTFVYNTQVKNQVKLMLTRNASTLIDQETAMLQREDCIAVLNTIICPTLIIHSAQDSVFNFKDSHYMATHIGHAKFVTIENCGHMSPLEAPQEVSRLMRSWLKLTINQAALKN